MPGNKHFFKEIKPGLEICVFSGLDQNFPAHFHKHYLIGCILNGKRRMLIAGKEYNLYPKDIVILNPGAVHGCIQDGETPLSWLGLHFSPAYMLELIKLVYGKPFLPTFKKWHWPNSPLADIFQELNTSVSNELNFNPLLENIIAEILKWDEDISNYAKIQESKPQKTFKDLIAHLQAHCPTPFSLSEMSNLAKMDKYEFVRKFNAIYGITPWRYLEAIRVNLGKEMLTQGQKVADVAVNCGFCDQSHFSRCFKARVGFSPLEVRKAMRAGS